MRQEKQHRIGHRRQNGAERHILRRQIRQKKHGQNRQRNPPVRHGCNGQPAQDALAAPEAQQRREIMPQRHGYAAQQHAFQIVAVALEHQARHQAGADRLDKIDGQHQQAVLHAVIPDEIGQPGVAAAVAADILVDHQCGNAHGAVQISQKIGRQRRHQNGKPHNYDSSLSPFWRMVIRTGVPCRPKTSRIWFSRYRW